MLQEIQNWITNAKRKYADGVKLYLKTRNGSKFDDFFQSMHDANENSIHFKMLVQKLSNIARIIGANSKIPLQNATAIKVDPKKSKPITVDPINIGTKAKQQIPHIDANPWVRIEELPENLQADFREIQKLTPQLKTWHEKAKAAKSDADRKEFINKAATIEEKRDELWNNINVWWLDNKGEGMDESKKSELEQKVEEFKGKHSNAKNAASEAIELNERIADLKTSISRANKELPKLKDKKLTNRKKSIAEWTNELEVKSARLKEITEQQ